MKKIVATFLAIIFVIIFISSASWAITARLRRISDGAIATRVNFGSVTVGNTYAQGDCVLEVEYSTGEDEDTLKLFSNNQTWTGAGERGGLVFPPSDRVEMFWTAYADPQQGVVLNAQNESSWKNMKDQNDPNFNSYDPINIALPLFRQTQKTYVYFGAKVLTVTRPATYSAALKLKNGAVNGGAGPSSAGNGFGSFNHLLYPLKGQPLQVQYNVASDSSIKILVYDRKGSEVKLLYSGDQVAGSHTATWSGYNNDGEMSPAGTFFVVYETPSERFRTKVVLLK